MSAETRFPTGPAARFNGQSPSLCASAGLVDAAYELKFLLGEPEARELEILARQRMGSDPHADPERGHSYTITSVYFDTPRLDVFHRGAGHRRCKYRLRRYDLADVTFLERKSKWGDRVKKRRAAVPSDETRRLMANPGDASWAGDWFHRRLLLRRLEPVCRLSYERVALVDLAEGMRLTFDRRVRGVLAPAWDLAPVAGGSLFGEQVICEFKYHDALPAFFKAMIEGLALAPRPVSKYRTFMASAGAGNRPPDPADRA